MPNLNKVMLMGNLTRDPEIKYTPKGTAIAAFGIAINRNWTTESGEKREEVTFVDVEAYARVAELLGEYVHKGDPLFIEGRLKLDTWDDKQSGQKRSKMKVIIENIQFLGGKKSGERHEGSGEHEGGYGGGGYGGGGRQTQQQQRRAPQAPPRPAADPDLDAAPDDIPF